MHFSGRTEGRTFSREKINLLQLSQSSLMKPEHIFPPPSLPPPHLSLSLSLSLDQENRSIILRISCYNSDGCRGDTRVPWDPPLARITRKVSPTHRRRKQIESGGAINQARVCACAKIFSRMRTHAEKYARLKPRA